MPLRNYCLLVGRPSELTLDDDDSPHIEIRMQEHGRDHRIALNVRSKLAPHPLLYRRVDPFTPETLGGVAGLENGLYDLVQDQAALALDYVHGGWLTKDEMRAVPYQASGANNDLKEFLLPLLAAAIDNPDAKVYAYGETWHEPHQRDRYFGFQPGRGIHDVHMNQGSTGQFRATNGPSQDGALLVRMPDRWIVVFLAFQSQSWDTDPATGHPRSTPSPRPPVDRSPHLDAVVQVVAALVWKQRKETGPEPPV